MVWFYCDDCGDSIKKPKLVNHFRQCSGSSFTCIDCSRIFTRATVNTHTTCVTEHEKYALCATKPGGFAEKGFHNDGAAAGGPAKNNDGEAVGLEFLSTRPPWKCRVHDQRCCPCRSVCNVNCTSRETLMGHATGIKHKRRARAAQNAANGGNANGSEGAAAENGAASAPPAEAKQEQPQQQEQHEQQQQQQQQQQEEQQDSKKAKKEKKEKKRKSEEAAAAAEEEPSSAGKKGKKAQQKEEAAAPSSDSSDSSDSDDEKPAKKGKSKAGETAAAQVPDKLLKAAAKKLKKAGSLSAKKLRKLAAKKLGDGSSVGDALLAALRQQLVASGKAKAKDTSAGFKLLAVDEAA